MELAKGLGSVGDLTRRFKKARERWELWRSIHQEAFDYASPQRETFHLRSPGQRKNRHIFDSTAVLGLEQFASRIQSSIVPSWQQWMNLKAGSSVPKQDKERVDSALEEITTTFFSNLNHSNFSTEITPALSDLGIGTGAIMVEEGEFKNGETFTFSNIPLSELYPENPSQGKIKTVWRKQKIAAGAIKEQWPQAELPTELAEKLKTDPLFNVKILNGMVFNTLDQKYHHVIIIEKAQKLLFTQAFDTQRIIVFRWHVTPNEVFGRGPVMQVLPDIRTVNKVKQFMLENAAIQMAGVYTGLDDGIFNPHTVRIAPGSVIPVSSNNSGNPSLQALPRSGDIGLGGFIMEDLQNTIKKALFSDPLGEINDPVRTATEIQIRNQMMLKQAGASIGRLKTELIEPLVNACIDILSGRGLIPKIKVDGKEITIKQTSPLAKAEDLEDFQNSQIWFSNVSQLGELVGPETILGTVKVENLPSYWAEKLGVPTELSRDEEEKRAFAEQAVKMSQMQQEQVTGGQPIE